MKKLLILTISILLFASFGFAAQVTSAGGVLTLGGGTDLASNTADTITIGLSSQVSAVYEDGGVTNPQWFAIGASHLGGNQVYGTAQDVTNLYRLAVPKVPGDPADWTGMPADSVSSNTWSGDIWEVM